MRLGGIVLGLLATTCAATPHPQITNAPALAEAPGARPKHCTTVYKDPLKESTWREAHKCWTSTKLNNLCRCVQAPGIMCQMMIKVETQYIPCTTDCCPTTATVTQDACPPCNPRVCQPAVETEFYYTGCERSMTVDSMRTVDVRATPISLEAVGGAIGPIPTIMS